MGRKQTEETKRKIRESWHKCHPVDSLETRQKKSISHIGKKRSDEFCRKNGERTKGKQYSLGTKRTAEQRKKMSESAPKGEKNHLWRGGVATKHNVERHRVEARLWREAVYARDNWKCQKCGKTGGFNAHHVKNFHSHPELRFAIDNGVTLCEKCHTWFHEVFGRLNNNETQMHEFLVFTRGVVLEFY